jgi:SAM-dependent methyltransferase
MQALIIQCAAFLIVLLIMTGSAAVADVSWPIAVAALLQGGLAAIIAYWRRAARWWAFIQFLFPVAVVTMQLLHLPPSLYLVAFIFLLGLYWTTFRTQVPFYPSNPAVWNAVATLLPLQQAIKLVDIGSGLGGLVLNLADRRPQGEFVGIELAPLAWLVSALRSRISGSRARFMRGDYFRLDFAQYDVVFAYLSPAAMPDLWHKARAEMRPGTLLLSYEFAIPGVPPHIAMLPGVDGPTLYGWHM